MLKTNKIEVTLKDRMQVLVPKSHLKSFLDQGFQRVKVIATFEDKNLEYYAAIKRYDDMFLVTYFSKNKQKELGVFLNDYFYMQFFEDQSKYGVEMPEELEAVLLSDELAFRLFEELSPGKKRTLIYSILKIKNPDLRISKSLNFCKNIKLGITDQGQWLKP